MECDDLWSWEVESLDNLCAYLSVSLAGLWWEEELCGVRGREEEVEDVDIGLRARLVLLDVVVVVLLRGTVELLPCNRKYKKCKERTYILGNLLNMIIIRSKPWYWYNHDNLRSHSNNLIRSSNEKCIWSQNVYTLSYFLWGGWVLRQCGAGGVSVGRGKHSRDHTRVTTGVAWVTIHAWNEEESGM